MDVSRVAIIGSGTIGRGWIPLFARAGIDVAVHDENRAAVERAIEAARVTLRDLAHHGLVDDPTAALARIRPAESLEAALDGADFVQESVPEQTPIKRAVLQQLDRLAGPTAIVSSSCSSLDPAEIFGDVAHPERCVVAHPFNPPHLLPLVELLPGPRTSESTIEATRALMTRLGQAPVVIRKAVTGYVANRLQAAVVNESMSLVGQGIISPEDLDLCVTESLGRRWAFIGPFETMDLNADAGIAAYAERYQGGYAEIGADLAASGPWPAGALETVVTARRRAVPVAALAARREWRDRVLMELLAAPLRKRGAEL